MTDPTSKLDTLDTALKNHDAASTEDSSTKTTSKAPATAIESNYPPPTKAPAPTPVPTPGNTAETLSSSTGVNTTRTFPHNGESF